MTGDTKDDAMKWYRTSAGLEGMAGYANVYDKDGRAVIVGETVEPGNIMKLLQRAYYEHGLSNPDYVLFQTKEQAVQDATRCNSEVT